MREVGVVLPLEPMEAGDSWIEWTLPLHLTVLPNVRIDETAVAEFLARVEALAASTDPVSATVEGRDLFGPDRDVPVSTVALAPALVDLHEQLLDLATELGATAVEPAHVRGGWRPHVTRSHLGREVVSGESVDLDAFVVVDCTEPMRVALRAVPLR